MRGRTNFVPPAWLGRAVIRTWLRASCALFFVLAIYADIREADERNDDQARAAELAAR